MRVGAIVLVTTLALGVAGLSACELVAGIEDIQLTTSASGAGGHTASSASAESSGSGSNAGSSNSSSTGGPGNACKEIESDPDLVAYYPLDETSGTIAHDCSGHGHDGNVMGALPNGGWSVGHFGGGFAPNGTTGCIDLGTPSELLLEGGPFTVAAWVNAKAFGVSVPFPRYIVSRAADPTLAGWRVGADVGAVWSAHFFDPASGSLYVQSTGGQPINQWVHVAVAFGGGVAQLFVGGAPSGPPTSFMSIAPSMAATLRIGCASGDQKYFNGTLDEVRFYKRGLSAAEIGALAAKMK